MPKNRLPGDYLPLVFKALQTKWACRPQAFGIDILVGLGKEKAMSHSAKILGVLTNSTDSREHAF